MEIVATYSTASSVTQKRAVTRHSRILDALRNQDGEETRASIRPAPENCDGSRLGVEVTRPERADQQSRLPIGATRAVQCEAEMLADPHVIEACTGFRTASSDGISNTRPPTPTSADGNPTAVTKLTTRTGRPSRTMTRL